MKGLLKHFMMTLCLLVGLLSCPFVLIQATELPAPVDGVLTITVTGEGELSSNYTAEEIRATGATCLKIVGPINSNDIRRISGSLSATLGQVDISETTFNDLNSASGYFLRNTYLRGIVLPEELTGIPSSFFSGCSNLSSVNFPSSLTYIGSYAFDQCKSLPETLTINVDGPLYIVGNAFIGSTEFTSISITADGDVTLGSGDTQPFTSSKIVTFELHTSGKLTSCNELLQRSSSTLVTAMFDARGEGSTMGSRAFCYCRNLTSVTLPTGLTALGDEFFRECKSLQSLTIPSSVTSLGEKAFYECEALTALDLSQTALTTIGASAFEGCKALTALDLSQTALATIGASAFDECEALESLSLPNTVTSIGTYAFYNCKVLTALDLSATTLTVIPNSMCAGCWALESLRLPTTVTSIGTYAFSNCRALTTLDLSQMSLSVIPTGMCNQCPTLATLFLPGTFNTIGEKAFYNCQLLTAIDIPSTVASIGNEAFYQCSSLQTITIPQSVTEMGTSVLYQCSALTSANVQADISTLPNSTFYECKLLSNVTLPSSLTTLGSSVFQNCWALKSILLPTTLTTIGSSAFQNSAITSIDLPSGLTSIGSSAFQSCYNLTMLEVPEGITQIPSYMLQGCYNLQTLYLPSTITAIGERALRVKVNDWNTVTPDKLIDVHVAATTPPTVASQYTISFSPVTLYVPESSVEDYAADNFWKTFNNIYAEQNNLSTLDDTEFALLQSLYTKLGGSNWTRKWTFGATKAETPLPYGVRLNDGHVVQLLLMRNNLSCTTLPVELMQFPQLWQLDLSDNQLSGKVDDLFASMAVNTALTILNLNDNQLTGNIGAIRQYDDEEDKWVDKLPNLFRLKVARNRIRDVKPTLPSHIGNGYWSNNNYFDISGQDLTNEVNPVTNQPFTFTDFAQANRTDFVDLFPSILAFKHSNTPNYYNTYYVIRPIDSSEPWAAKFYKNFNSNDYTSVNVEQYKTEVSAWNHDAPNTLVYLTDNPNNNGNESEQSRMIITFDFAMGDVNYDSFVNVSDLQTLINFAMQFETMQTSTPFNFYAADISTLDDGESRTIDVLDVIGEVNLLLDRDIVASLARPHGANGTFGTNEAQPLHNATLIVENGQLALESEVPVAALDLTLYGSSIEWSSELSLFSRKSRGNRTIIYSLMGDVLPAGRTVLGTVGSDAKVMAAQLCDLQGQLIATSLGGETTGFSTVESEGSEGATDMIYDLQGRCVVNSQWSMVNGQLPKGVYIVNGKKIVK